MPRPPLLPRHARTPTLPAIASTFLLRPRTRARLVHVSSRAAAAAVRPLVAAVASTDLTSSYSTSVTSTPPPSVSSSTSRLGGCSYLIALTLTASAVAVSACLLFFSAMRSMLACKSDAEFLEKYFDSARAKLPETLASVRLVGREISDLAADLSDLSQEMTKGVKSSMTMIHTAEAKLRLTPSTCPESPQRMSNQNKRLDETLLASTVRNLRELIADIRSGFGTASGMARATMWVSNFGSSQKNRSKRKFL